MKLRLAPLEKSYDKPTQHIKKQKHYFTDKGPSSQSYGFSGSCVWMWELDHIESCVLKNWCFWTVVLGKTLERPLNCKEIQLVNRKGNQSWIFIGRADAEYETLILWPLDAKNWLTGKDPDAGKDWRWEKKGMTEDEMVGCHQWLDGHKCEHALGVGDGQGSLVCCSPSGHKESDMTEQLNWLKYILISTFLWQIRFFRGRYWEAVRGARCSLGINIWSGKEAGQHRGCEAESLRDGSALSWAPEPLYASSLSHWRRGLSWERSDLEQKVSFCLK